MARVGSISLMLSFFFYSSLLLCFFTSVASANVELDEDNWRQILDGEWMVEL